MNNTFLKSSLVHISDLPECFCVYSSLISPPPPVYNRDHTLGEF